MSAPVHLRALQALELAVRLGSLKAAAERLTITPAAVGQRIKTLEDYLGFELLVRTRSGIRPTSELEAAMPHLTAAFREIDAVARVLDFQRTQELHILADSDWAELWLAPRLPDFRAQHPNVLFNINGVGDVPVRLGQHDLEIFFGAEEAGVLLFRDWMVPVNSPSNTARLRALPQRSALEGFPLQHLDCYRDDPEALDWPKWVSRFDYDRTAPERGIRYRQVVHALDSVYSNAGPIICGLTLVRDLVDKGRLALPFAPSEGAWTGHGYRVRFRPSALRREPVQWFRGWLFAQAGEALAATERVISGAEDLAMVEGAEPM